MTASAARTLGEFGTPFAVRCFHPIGVLLYKDSEGAYWTDPMWLKDLRLHLQYLPSTTVASPCRHGAPPDGWERIELDQFPGLELLELPYAESSIRGILALPSLIRGLARGRRGYQLIYAGFVEWPLPYGWFMRLLMPKSAVFYSFIESSFWRLTPGLPSTLRQKVRALVTERLNAAALRRCDLAFITQDGYRSLLTSEKTEIVKTAPSWLDDEWLVSAAEADELAEQRLEEPRLRVLFAGRVEREKGIEILLRASAKVGSDAMALTVLGDGSAREAMVALAEELGCAVSWADPVPYGQPFLAQLRAADLLVVPSLSDEQPRVVFDAMSQGLVVLASSTRGLTDVLDADTSLLVKSGDVGELSDSLRWASEHKDECVHMGRLSRDRVTSWTHSGAHRVRYAAFEALLGGSARPQR